MVIAVRAAMSHYAPHLLFIKPVFFHLSLSTPSVLSCARHLLWRVSLFLRSLARYLMPASRMFILRHNMPRKKR